MWSRTRISTTLSACFSVLVSERKRMFMHMKREVLRLGGYAREYFVSQTPELTQMADVVIDLVAFGKAGAASIAPAAIAL